MTRVFTRILLADWPRRDVEDLTRLITRLAETVHTKLEVLPELAIAEFCKAHPDTAMPDLLATVERPTPPRGRRR
jgi:hypothetical protein